MARRSLKAALHVANLPHPREHMQYLAEGLTRHGIEVVWAPYDQPRTGDFAACWGWKRNMVKEHCIREKMPLLILEAGHLQPRLEWTSMGWNGLAGRATYANRDDAGQRWRILWRQNLKPWLDAPNGYALVCGQVDGDAALYGLDVRKWAQTMADLLRDRKWDVVFRPHPLGDRWGPQGARLSTASLEDDLAGAAFAVTYNSTCAVEAVLAGVPTITRDQGSMAWPVTSHSLDEPLVRPNRDPWGARLAWAQFSDEEIRSGFAWEAVREVMPDAA